MPLSKNILNTINEFNKSLEKYLNDVTKENKHQNIRLKNIQTGKKILEWSLKKYKLQFEAGPKFVFERDIFYCQLGTNVGQEQEGKRPVVILQNDAGNKSSSHTIVAPITTFENATFIKISGKMNVQWEEDGVTQSRQLYYYEIPVVLEKGFKKAVKGVVNLTQIKTVSKKRLVVPDLAKITEDCKNEIDVALIRLLNMSQIKQLQKENTDLHKKITKLELEIKQKKEES